MSSERLFINKSTSNKSNKSWPTRKEFLKIIATGALSPLLIPTTAIAVEQSDSISDRYSLYKNGATARELWENASNQAVLENSIITYNYSDGKTDRQLPKTTRTRKTSQASTALTVAGVPDSIHAVAVYNVTSEQRNSTLYDTWLSCTTSQVGHTYASDSIIDSGRTLAIYYAATISNYFNFSQALEAYAEFGTTGARYMRANWV